MVRHESQRGAALIEFALVSLALYLLLAATIEFGRLMFSAQGMQDIARLAARELAVAPLPADITFEAALTYVDPVSGNAPVLQRIFNPACLVVNLDTFASDDDIDAFFAAMPLVNKALRPLMIIDRSTGAILLRYPGALLSSNDPAATCAGQAAPYTVGIPRVTARGADGEETFDWIPVLQEIRGDPADPSSGPFALSPGHEGIVALRVNYPYQAATIGGFRASADGAFEPNINNRIVADDSMDAPVPPTGTVLAKPDPADDAFYGPYAGRYGLGRLATPLGNGQGIRPFRKLLAAQAIYRREVFQ
jgi:TadE-like protein